MNKHKAWEKVKQIDEKNLAHCTHFKREYDKNVDVNKLYQRKKEKEKEKEAFPEEGELKYEQDLILTRKGQTKKKNKPTKKTETGGVTGNGHNADEEKEEEEECLYVVYGEIPKRQLKENPLFQPRTRDRYCFCGYCRLQRDNRQYKGYRVNKKKDLLSEGSML